jgi:putative endonuclease
MAGSYIYILGSHTGTLYIGVTSNLYLRVMQHKEGTLEGFTATCGSSACSTLRVTKTFAQPSLGKNNSKAGGAKRSSTSFARSIPSSDFAQTWGWKMITVHEKMYP